MDLTQNQIQQMVEDALNKREQYNQYNVSPIPSHVHNGTDSSKIDYNDLVNIPTTASNVSGWKLVSYSTATGSSLTLSGLDLSTDLTYKIVINTWVGVAASADALNLRFNNDSSAVYGVTQMSYSSASTFATTQTTFQLTGGDSFPVIQSEINVHYSGGVLGATASGHTVGINGLTTATAVPYIYDTGCSYVGSNVTSINLYMAGSNSQTFNVWVYKLLTS